MFFLVIILPISFLMNMYMKIFSFKFATTYFPAHTPGTRNMTIITWVFVNFTIKWHLSIWLGGPTDRSLPWQGGGAIMRSALFIIMFVLGPRRGIIMVMRNIIGTAKCFIAYQMCNFTRSCKGVHHPFANTFNAVAHGL